MLAGPRISTPRSVHAVLGVSVVEGSIAAGRNRSNRRQIRGRARAFIGSRSGADDEAGQMIVLRQDEAAEILAGLLVPYSAVDVLQAEHPIKIPTDFGEKVGEFPAGLRNLEIKLVHRRVQHFPRPKQSSGRYAGIHHVSAVVAGVMPPPVILVRTGLSSCLVKLGREMTRWVRIAIPQVHIAAASLAVISPHGELQSLAINLLSNFKKRALAGISFKNVVAGLANLREVDNLNAVARRGVVARLGRFPLQSHCVTINVTHGKSGRRRA